ncbi:MAG: sigma-70 family RNA polymerase sigma factor [Chloroflexota bacterium]
MTLTKSSKHNASRLGERLWELLTESRQSGQDSEQREVLKTNSAVTVESTSGWLSTKPGITTPAEIPQEQPDADSKQFRKVDPDEAQLIYEAKQNSDRFGILYERYVDRVYAYIYNRVGNAQDSEDLTARTFYQALSKLDSYEDRGFPFSAWLFRIAHNLVANWHRDNSKRHFLSLDRLWSHSREEELPEAKVERAENHNELWEAINRLPEERRDLLIYKFSSRLSNLEIGELMNKSESAIKSLYFRTLATLRTDLESREREQR